MSKIDKHNPFEHESLPLDQEEEWWIYHELSRDTKAFTRERNDERHRRKEQRKA